MKQIVTEAIILSRTDFGEADRILTVLTPDQGKLRLLAKGVRRVKSKLAGGIELFSVSAITYIQGRGEMGTLISTRLITYYRHIVTDLDRTMAGYDLIKQLNKLTEDEPDPEYFRLLQQTFAALDEVTVPLELVRFWFSAQLLSEGGHKPNLEVDTNGAALQAGERYNFDHDHMAFSPPTPSGRFTSDHIKFLRLIFARHTPATLAKVQGGTELATATLPLVQTMLQAHLRV